MALNTDQRVYSITKQGKRRKSQKQDFEDIIEEKNDTLKEEYKKLSKIKDPIAKIWKIRKGVLGSKHKAPEPTCISHPTTGELVATPEEIKKCPSSIT